MTLFFFLPNKEYLDIMVQNRLYPYLLPIVLYYINIKKKIYTTKKKYTLISNLLMLIMLLLSDLSDTVTRTKQLLWDFVSAISYNIK
jgi:hypothetical protein